MAGTKAGGLKAAASNKERHGNDFYRLIGKPGGEVQSSHKGFGHSHDWAVAMGKLGGKAVRKRKVEN